VTHIEKQKLSNFICTCCGCLVSFVAAATSISTCPNTGSDIQLQRTKHCFTGHQTAWPNPMQFFLMGIC